MTDHQTAEEKLPASVVFARAQQALRDADIAFNDAEQRLLRAKRDYNEAWKAIARAAGYGSSEPQDRGGRALCRDAADEIERLTAALDYYHKRWQEDGVRIDDAEAERDRLRAEVEHWKKSRDDEFEIRDAVSNTNARLRAALEKLKKLIGPNVNPESDWDLALGIIEIALAGEDRPRMPPMDSRMRAEVNRGTDETSVGHPVVACIYRTGCRISSVCMNAGRCCALEQE